ncbi:MAG: zinc ribbon domain-containing protein [Methanobrevibacter sp.]|nr:zinc ribbon domain-containing protein [Methanobrevibacter sp.]
MVQYCRKCGQELDDDAEFCVSCGYKLNETPTQNTVKSKGNSEFVTKLPLILAIIAIIVSVAEGLGTPMLFGWDNILAAMALGIIGGIIGIVLMEKLDEPLIAAVEFIATGALVFMFIGRFGEISAVLFIIVAILALYFKGYYANNKKLWAIPVLTVVLIFVIIIVGGALYHINAENSITVGNVTQNIKNDGYGYFDGSVSGDIHVDSTFDYLEVTINFYDSQDKIIQSTIGWNDANPESGKTYTFDGMYFDQKQPAKAEIKVIDSVSSQTPLYTENITISTTSGV